MGQKFVRVTLDLDEGTLKILEMISAQRASSVSDVAQELISGAVHELMVSRENIVTMVQETLRAMGPDRGRIMESLLALGGKETSHKPKDDTLDEAAMALLVIEAGSEVFGSEHEFLELLTHPVLALGNKIPLDLLSSPDGLQTIIDLLGRIQHGIPS